MRLSVGMEYDRTPPEAWERSIWSVAPPSEHLSWLKLRWEPGDPWDPINRWVIWQMRPRWMVHHPSFDPLRRRELMGPSPRSEGHFCTKRSGYPPCPCRRKTEKWRFGAARTIDRAQWKLFQDTGCYGTRWWVIQGDTGGHRHRLDLIEQKVARFHGVSGDTPRPGDLPYADYDMRTFKKILDADRVLAWKGTIAFYERPDVVMDEEERKIEQQAGELLWGWLESQVKQTNFEMTRAERQALIDAAPRIVGSRDTLDTDGIKHDFITDGAA